VRAIVLSNVNAFRNARDAIDAHFGLPAAGVNKGTGQPAGPNQPGWTDSYYDGIQIIDTGGLLGTGGASKWLIGPISAADEARILTMASPPTIATVPDSVFRRGTRIRKRAQTWGGNGKPATFREEIPGRDRAI
jgi:hypothetical protein